MSELRKAAAVDSALLIQLLRGVIGFVAIGAGIWISGQHQPWAIPAFVTLVVVALVAWRGCPTCWLMGLMARISAPRRRAR
jgi:hypothetical protein